MMMRFRVMKEIKRARLDDRSDESEVDEDFLGVSGEQSHALPGVSKMRRRYRKTPLRIAKKCEQFVKEKLGSYRRQTSRGLQGRSSEAFENLWPTSGSLASLRRLDGSDPTTT
jgi:hypothetical protein